MRFVSLVVALVLVALGAGGAAAATDPWLTVRIEGGGSALQFAPMAPGEPVSQDVALTVAEGAAGRLALGVADVVSHEGGCLDNEVRAGDTTCGTEAGEGELLPWLRVRVERLDGGVPAIAEAAFADLVDDRLDLGDARAGVPVPLRISVWPDRAAGNDTMTDEITFALRWYGAGRVATADAGGAAGTGVGDAPLADGPGRERSSGWAGLGDLGDLGDLAGLGRTLPGTGTPFGPWLPAGGVAALVTGLALLRRRPARERGAPPAGIEPATPGTGNQCSIP